MFYVRNSQMKRSDIFPFFTCLKWSTQHLGGNIERKREMIILNWESIKFTLFMILFYIMFSSLSPLILKTQQNWDGQITQFFTSCQSKIDVSIKGQLNAIISACTSQIQFFSFDWKSNQQENTRTHRRKRFFINLSVFCINGATFGFFAAAVYISNIRKINNE